MSSISHPDTPASPSMHKLQQLLLGALALGVLADLLIWDREPASSGFALWALCFTIGYAWLRLQQEAGWPGPASLVWIAMAPMAAAMPVLRALEGYTFLMLLLMALATTLVAALARPVPWQHLRLPDLLRAFLQSALRLAIGLPLILHALRSTGTSASTAARASPWLRGLILALPLLALFMTLFYLADAGFSKLLDVAGSFIGAEAGNHLLRSALFTWLCGGLLHALLYPATQTPPTPAGNTGATNSFAASLGQLEISIILGSLCLLFVSFTLLQLGYLFGGSTTIEMTPGLTVAEYARRGFFELLIVSLLTLLVLMGLGYMAREQRRFRLFASVLLACVFIMQASAVQRLLLYVDNFGLTLDRWMAAWMLLWIAGVLAWFVLNLWRENTRGFVYGSATGAAVLLLLCLASNPAARVAERNLQRHIDEGATLDTAYLQSLGADAVPVTLARFDALAPLARCDIARQVLDGSAEWLRLQQEGWRHYSWGRARALRAMEAHRPALEAMRADAGGTCPSAP